MFGFVVRPHHRLILTAHGLITETTDESSLIKKGFTYFSSLIKRRLNAKKTLQAVFNSLRDSLISFGISDVKA